MGPSPANTLQLRLSSGSELLEWVDWVSIGPGASIGPGTPGALSLPTGGAGFLGVVAPAGGNVAVGGETDVSLLAGSDDFGSPRSPETSTVHGSGQSFMCESTAGSLPAMPCGTANSISGTLCSGDVCGAKVGAKWGAGRALGAWAGPFVDPVTIAARLSICSCALDCPALTVINTSHGPTFPAEGTMEARPF